MHKLTMHLPIILIGLSLFMFSGCGLTDIDPPEKRSVVKFLNSSNQNVTFKLINHPLSGNDNDIIINVVSMSEEGNNEYVYEEKAIDEYFSIISSDSDIRIELYLENNIVKVWTPPSGSFGNDINSPFNYDSWKFESIKPTGNNVVGKIVFTITNADIE